MRIFHLIYDHTDNPWVGGGGAHRVYEIYRRLAETHDVTVICGKYPGARDYKKDNLEFHFVGTDKNNYILSTFCYAVGGARYLWKKGNEADIVVEDFAPYNPVFSPLMRKDAVIQLHQREGLHHFRKYLILGAPFFLTEKFYPGFFKNAVVVSETSRVKYGLPGTAAVIPNGFDESYLSVPEGKGDYILFLGRLEMDSKGLDILLKAVDYLEGVDLKIAGKGKDEGRVRTLVERTRPGNKVEMPGFLQGKDKINILKDCAFVVIPSRFEGQPLTLLEAAAFGKPVVVSNVPGLKTATDAGFGVSFKTEDPEDLADKINYLIKNEPVRKQMARRARQYAKDHTWENIAAEYERFLLSCIKGGR